MVDKVLKIKPDVIYLPNFAVFSSQIITALSKAGYKGAFVAADSWGEATNGVFHNGVRSVPFEGYTLRHYTLYEPNQSLDKLRGRFEAKGLSLNGLNAYYYDTVDFVLSTIVTLDGEITRKYVNNKLHKMMNFQGLAREYCLNNQCKDSKLSIVAANQSGFRFYGKI